MLAAVSIIGHHNSGKTRLIAQLIPILVDRGYRVGTAKHAPHLEEIDPSDSDSAVHRSAGAERVLLLGETTAALVWELDDTEGLEEMLERLFSDCDIVLVEGAKHGPLPKIEVYRHHRGRGIVHEPLAGEIDVECVVTDDAPALPDGVRVLSPRSPFEIAEFIEERFC